MRRLKEEARIKMAREHGIEAHDAGTAWSMLIQLLNKNGGLNSPVTSSIISEPQPSVHAKSSDADKEYDTVVRPLIRKAYPALEEGALESVVNRDEDSIRHAANWAAHEYAAKDIANVIRRLEGKFRTSMTALFIFVWPGQASDVFPSPSPTPIPSFTDTTPSLPSTPVSSFATIVPSPPPTPISFDAIVSRGASVPAPSPVTAPSPSAPSGQQAGQNDDDNGRLIVHSSRKKTRKNRRW